MKQLICDKCGSPIVKEKAEQIATPHIYMEICEVIPLANRKVDLCPECTKKVIDFIYTAEKPPQNATTEINNCSEGKRRKWLLNIFVK